MSTLSDLVSAQGRSSESDIEWLHRLAGDGQLLADLASADIVVWAPTADDSYVAVAHTRPGGAATLFYRDIVGGRVRPQWQAQVREAFQSVRIVDSSSPEWFEETPTRVRAVPIAIREGDGLRAIAVLTRHTNLGDVRTPSRQQITFNECADDLFRMIATGDFPDLSAPTGPRRGAPRAADGLIRLDVDGVVTFASPNALSAFNRIGFAEELEGEALADVTSQILPASHDTDERLPILVSGRAPWRSDVEARGVTVSLRAIPLKEHGHRTGAIVLCRDVSELRSQEQELITKDATIREIHHRVKNNLQTVASLLRIQSRRTSSDEARESLLQAMQRVAAIAVVHDTLSEGLAQNVDFDEVFARVLRLVAEVAAAQNTVAHTRTEGRFGTLPSQYATPLALALTEIVTNAVEHGLAGREGDVQIVADRDESRLEVRVRDTGSGLPDGQVGRGLGTQIVRTLIQGELSGTIDWKTIDAPDTPFHGGTEVVITVPLRWIVRS
ncbi:histidine kinase N-terminal domain-containing protein [Microbacterium oryzae]|uniref:sensor histidine kinase n=1 Tax=Microbacterium oryzae TaxID=743009 RepID=UPI0025AFFF76|nr:PAS domain-containing sensor histidine kinase [Microbacterium oryzae]MDN3309883.1 histidine kinase N-terminal domain-containing protein [Microbacterium oryzae]